MFVEISLHLYQNQSVDEIFARASAGWVEHGDTQNFIREANGIPTRKS